jgi:hypothetical protein
LAQCSSSFNPWSLGPIAFGLVARQHHHIMAEADGTGIYSPHGSWKAERGRRGERRKKEGRN